MRLFASRLAITPRRRVGLTVVLAAGLAVAIGSGAMAANAATPAASSPASATQSQAHHTAVHHTTASRAAGSRTEASFERIIRASEASCTVANPITADAGKAAIKADRAAAAALAAGSPRTAARAAIHTKALSGGYGSRIQAHAEAVAGRTELHLGKLPAALVTDMKAVRSAAPSARLALDTAIAKKAVDGSYGAAVTAAAEKIEGLGCVIRK